MTLHNKNNPRHARIFEILRQNDMAIGQSDEVQNPYPVRAKSNTLDALRNFALNSFGRSGGVGTKPGRDDELL